MLVEIPMEGEEQFGTIKTGPRSWPEPEMGHGLQLSSTHVKF